MRPIFKTLDGVKVDPIKYSLDYIHKNPDTKIYIGTDSSSSRKYTTYATVIAFRNGNRGAHIIVQKRRIPKIKDNYMRLWNEVVYTMELVQWFSDNSSLKIEAVELDYNSDEQYYSNRVMKLAKGWVTGIGLRVLVKPEEQLAIRAADKLCQ